MESTERRNDGWLLIAGWIGLNIVSLLLAWGGTMLILSLIVKVVGDTIQVAGQTHITEDYLASFVLIPMLGLIAGLLQFLVIRRLIPRAGGWILATFLGWVIPFAIIWLLSILNPVVLAGNTFLALPFLLIMVGGVLGLTQWLVLKSHIRQSGWWILISGLAWGLTGLIIGSTISETYDSWILLLLPALATGLGLWLLLVWRSGRQTG
jgi:hypothetical protein